MNSIMEAVNWVCDDILDDHLWMSEVSLALQEATILEAQNCDRGPLRGALVLGTDQSQQ